MCSSARSAACAVGDGAHGRARGGHARGAGAFTLIEILVVIAIIALMAVALIPSLGGIRRAKLQDMAFSVSRLSRNALLRALSHADTVRMVVDLDEHRIWLEEAGSEALVNAQGAMVIPDGGEDEEDADGGALPATGIVPTQPLTRSRDAGEADGGLLGSLFGGSGGGLFGGSSSLDELRKPPKYRPPDFTALDEPRMRPIQFAGVSAMRVYLPGAEEPVTEGRAYIFYHDDGTADAAVVHLEDERHDVYAIAIQPLTGRGALYPYPYIPEPPEVNP